MAKVKPQGSSRPLLSTWEAPSNAGSPIGVLATTFTLDPGLDAQPADSKTVAAR